MKSGALVQDADISCGRLYGGSRGRVADILNRSRWVLSWPIKRNGLKRKGEERGG